MNPPKTKGIVTFYSQDNRKYVKLLPMGEQEERVTYEISVMRLLSNYEKMILG